MPGVISTAKTYLRASRSREEGASITCVAVVGIDQHGVLADSPVTAFVGVSDLAQAHAFYGATLGLSLRDESPFALVAQVHGTLLRITATGGPVAPAPYTVLGWRVSAIEDVVDALVAR